jgi:hypothetical protein
MAAKLVQFSHHPVANGEYTVRVGDLCYVLIGQIVNRNLTAVRSEGVSVIINSPVETPALAAAVRQDWAHLTPDEHALSLVQDIDLHHGNVALTYARLCYYYPKAGEKPVLEVLDRLPTSYKGIRAFLIQNVLSSDDPQIWERRLNEVGGTWGSVNLNLYIARLKAWTKYRPDDLPEISPTGPALSPWSLQDIFFTRRIHGTTGGGFLIEETLRQPEWDRARQIIQLWTNAAASHGNLNQEVRTEEVNIQAAVLEGLNDYVNPYVDEATYKLFVRAKSANHMQIIDDTSMDHLALVCANRLAGKGHDADFRDYFEKRLLQLTDYSSQTRSWVARINQVLAKLKPAETAEK